MGKAIIAFILSVGVGTWLSFFNHGIGVVVSISIIGAFLIEVYPMSRTILNFRG